MNASSESVYEEGGDCLFSCRGGGICSSFTSSMNSTPRSPRYSFIDADRKRLFSCGKSPNMALAPIPPTASPRCSRQGIREGVKQLKYILSSHQQTAETSNLQPSPELQPESQVESPLSDASGERVKSGVEKMEKQDGSVAGVS